MKTSIFYMNSIGFLCQWKGEVVRKDFNSIVIKFSKNKILKFTLNDCPMMIITKKVVKDCGFAVDQTDVSLCYDEEIMNKAKEFVKDNISLEWNGKDWIET